MRHVRNLAWAFTLAVLVGCAALGVPKPETFNQRLASGYATVTTVRQTTLTLLESRTISSADAQNVQNQANTAREGLDVARDIHRTLPQAGEDKLAVTNAVLQSLQKYLASKRSK